MAKKFLVNIDMGNNSVVNANIATGSIIKASAKVESASSAPSAAGAGSLYFNTTGGGSLWYATASGTGSWVQIATGSSAVSSINSITGAVTISGTSNQVTVTNNSPSAGTITLSLPQDIATTSKPQFAALGVGTSAPTAGLTVSGGKATLAPSVTGYAPLNIATGTAPTSPASGDIWVASDTIYFRNSSSATKTVAYTDSNITGSAGSVANALTIGTGLSGTSYNGSAGVTIAIDSTVATLSGTQTFTNKSFSDSTTYFIDETDGTKKLQFQLSGITTATTRTLTVPDASGTIALTSNNLGAFAATTSAQLLSVISDETGSGKLVFATSPTFTTSVVTDSATFAVFNTTATTVNAFGAGTTISIGAATGTTTVNNSLVVSGDLTVNGTTTNLNSTNLVVEDKNIIIADVATPSNTTADGAGITIKGATDKTFNWVNATSAFTASEHIDLASGKAYYIAGTSVLSGSTLGSGVTSSSLTKIGALSAGTAGFVKVDASGNLTSDATTYAANNQTFYIGTTQVAINRTSGALTLAGVSLSTLTFGTGLDGNAATYNGSASATVAFKTGSTAAGANDAGSSYAYGVQKATATLTGTGSKTSWTISHNLNSRDVQVQVYQTSATPDTQYAEVEVDIVRTATGTITVTFATAPVLNDTYNVVIVG